MLVEIVKRTPSWVFVLFFVLLALGYMQSKDRTISRGKVAILPSVMIGLSFYGVISAFGIAQVGLTFWLAGVSAGMLGITFLAPRGVSYATETKLYTIKGSWIPLMLMMTIFFTKYTVGVIMARALPITHEPIFIGIVCLCYGLISGLFLMRAFAIWRTPECTRNSVSNPHFS